MSVQGADARGCHCCQCSTSKRLTLVSRVEFSFLKMLWIRFLNLSENSWGRHCGEMLSYAGGTFFRIVPFLIQFTILCNVLTKRISLFWQLTLIFSELLYGACFEAMAFRKVGIGQWYIFQKCRKNNKKNSFEQYLPEKLAGMLQVSKVVDFPIDLNLMLC